MSKNWVVCTSKDHEGRKVYINLDRVDIMYEDDGQTFVVMAGWDSEETLHLVESPEVILAKSDED